MSHKRSKERMQALDDRLLNGMMNNGIPRKTVRIFLTRSSHLLSTGFLNPIRRALLSCYSRYSYVHPFRLLRHIRR